MAAADGLKQQLVDVLKSLNALGQNTDSAQRKVDLKDAIYVGTCPAGTVACNPLAQHCPPDRFTSDPPLADPKGNLCYATENWVKKLRSVLQDVYPKDFPASMSDQEVVREFMNRKITMNQINEIYTRVLRDMLLWLKQALKSMDQRGVSLLKNETSSSRSLNLYSNTYEEVVKPIIRQALSGLGVDTMLFGAGCHCSARHRAKWGVRGGETGEEYVSEDFEDIAEQEQSGITGGGIVSLDGLAALGTKSSSLPLLQGQKDLDMERQLQQKRPVRNVQLQEKPLGGLDSTRWVSTGKSNFWKDCEEELGVRFYTPKDGFIYPYDYCVQKGAVAPPGVRAPDSQDSIIAESRVNQITLKGMAAARGAIMTYHVGPKIMELWRSELDENERRDWVLKQLSSLYAINKPGASQSYDGLRGTGGAFVNTRSVIRASNLHEVLAYFGLAPAVSIFPTSATAATTTHSDADLQKLYESFSASSLATIETWGGVYFDEIKASFATLIQPPTASTSGGTSSFDASWFNKILIALAQSSASAKEKKYYAVALTMSLGIAAVAAADLITDQDDRIKAAIQTGLGMLLDIMPEKIRRKVEFPTQWEIAEVVNYMTPKDSQTFRKVARLTAILSPVQRDAVAKQLRVAMQSLGKSPTDTEIEDYVKTIAMAVQGTLEEKCNPDATDSLPQVQGWLELLPDNKQKDTLASEQIKRDGLEVKACVPKFVQEAQTNGEKDIVDIWGPIGKRMMDAKLEMEREARNALFGKGVPGGGDGATEALDFW